MSPQIHRLLVLLVVLTLTLLLESSETSHQQPRMTTTTTTLEKPPVPDNETIYKISKSLCWNCIGESIQFLFAQNLVRAAKWELPLIWDFQLENYAKWWAGQRRADCAVRHSFPEDGFKLGENIYWGSGSTWTPADAVGAWAGEEKYYNYRSNSCIEGQMCGHYTQIVWKNTRRVGCARVVCQSGDVFMTCNYFPPGNYIVNFHIRAPGSALCSFHDSNYCYLST